MNSEDRSEDLHLERDLPTTQADIAALRRMRHQSKASFAEALESLSALAPIFGKPPDHPLSKDWEPFQL